MFSYMHIVIKGPNLFAQTNYIIPTGYYGSLYKSYYFKVTLKAATNY